MSNAKKKTFFVTLVAEVEVTAEVLRMARRSLKLDADQAAAMHLTKLALQPLQNVAGTRIVEINAEGANEAEQ